MRPLVSQPQSFPPLCHESDGADGSTSEGTQSLSGKGTHNPVSGQLSQMWGACRAVSGVGLPRHPIRQGACHNVKIYQWSVANPTQLVKSPSTA